MNAADRAALERVEKRLSAIEVHQRAQLMILRDIVGLFGDVVDDKAERNRPPVPGERHLYLVRSE